MKSSSALLFFAALSVLMFAVFYSCTSGTGVSQTGDDGNGTADDDASDDDDTSSGDDDDDDASVDDDAGDDDDISDDDNADDDQADDDTSDDDTVFDDGIIQNGDFEMGRKIWVEQNGPIIVLGPDSYWGHAYQGKWLAYFGGYINADQSITQLFKIPQNTNWIEAGFVALIFTADTTTDNDVLNFELLDQSETTVLQSLQTLTNMDAYSNWRDYGGEKIYVNGAYDDQNVKLRIRVKNTDHTSGWDATHWHIDNVYFRIGK